MAKNFVELGVSGLTQFGGRVEEEWLRQLRGDRARRTFREMADNDSTIGSILFAIEMLVRQVVWRVESYDDSPEHREQAEFVESLMDDMSHTWGDFVSEVLTMLPFGFAPHEIVYKRRVGPYEKDPTRRSRHSDGLIGWRKLPLRSQDTLDRWEFDAEGGVKGLWQQPPDGGPVVFIPIEKLLLFRTTSRKSNPEGRSILRNAYVDWYHKTRIENYEAIGVERDLAGLPLLYLPPELMDTTNPENAPILAEYKRIMQNVRNDEQACIILPSIYDEHGNQTLKFELVGTGARRLFDTSAIIQRYDRKIASTVLADFIMLGHEKVGSFALSSDKTTMFATAVGAWLNEIASVINRHGVSRLYELNGWNPAEAARIVPGDLEKADIDAFASAVEKLTNSGWLTPGGEEDEDHIRGILDLPKTPTDRDLLRDLSRPAPGPFAPGSGDPAAGAVATGE